MILKTFSTSFSIRPIVVGIIVCLACFTVHCSSAGVSNESFGSISDTTHFNLEESIEVFVNKDVLVLGKYGRPKRRLVKKGTMIKVYLVAESLQTKQIEDMFSGDPTYRGSFESVIGDVLTIGQRGKEVKININDIYQIKVYNEIGARVFGDLVTLTSIAGFGIAGHALLAGGSLAFQGDPWAQLALFYGGVFAGMSFLVQRLALIIRRTKYDLVDDWYIVQNI